MRRTRERFYSVQCFPFEICDWSAWVILIPSKLMIGLRKEEATQYAHHQVRKFIHATG